MKTLRYVGPHKEGVEVVLPDGRSQIVLHGDTGEFPDAVAESLLEQGTDNWEAAKAAPEKPAKKAAETVEPAGDDEHVEEVK